MHITVMFVRLQPTTARNYHQHKISRTPVQGETSRCVCDSRTDMMKATVAFRKLVQEIAHKRSRIAKSFDLKTDDHDISKDTGPVTRSKRLRKTQGNSGQGTRKL